MAFKTFTLDERTQVTIYKRKGSRSLRLTITANGSIRVSIPMWAPYRAGLEFAKSKQSWIESQRRDTNLLGHGQSIGKAHRLSFVPDISKVKPVSRISGTEIVVTYPSAVEPQATVVQKVAHSASIRALRLQAEQLLPQRLQDLAKKYNFDYGNVTVKQLRGRWGSCDQHGNIVLNLFLMQLPWDLIDYVLLHELTHTEILRHGPDFWTAMEQYMPDAKTRRKRMRNHQPVLDFAYGDSVA